MRREEERAMRKLAWRSLARSRRVLLASGAAVVFALLAAFALSRFGYPIGDARTRYALLMAFIPVAMLGVVNQANLLGIDAGATLALAGAPGGLVGLFRAKARVTLLWNLGIVAVALPAGLSRLQWDYLLVAAFQVALTLLVGALGGLTSALLPTPRPFEKVGATTVPVGISLLHNAVSILFVVCVAILFDRLSGAALAAAAAGTVAACGAAWWHACSSLVPRLLRARGEQVLTALQEAV